MKLLDEHGISAELLSIIENTNDLMFVKNQDFVYIASSRSYALDCVRCNSVEDVIGKTDFELFEDQSIAARYRADDEALFASGKTMTEFQEEYPDKDGKKHYCKTTKYLLHDSAGNPVAIFGQYHDIGEQVEAEIERRRDMEHKISESLNSVFYASYFINLQDYSFSVLKGKDYAKKALKNCKNILEAYEYFIHDLVIPEDQSKMREFCKVDTVAERLGSRTHIDCEYRGTFVNGWCQTSFLPVDYDENGKVTHVLFVLSSIDQNRARNLEEGLSSKKTLESIFDEVPGGIILYEWNGKELNVLKMSKYYRDLYGDSMLNDTNSPDFVRIHPDDVADYRKAIQKALTETHHLEYVFRAWTQRFNRYVWTQITAISQTQPDGTSLVYAIYTDVTQQKEAELEASKKQASLEAALNVSNQMCCEYDPVNHVIACFTETNLFQIPTPLPDYPDCVREINFIHPDDVELFIDTVHSTDDGQHSAHCDVRAMRDGEYRWYSCRLEPYYDPEKERNVIILTIIDSTLRVASIKEYEDRIQLYYSLYKDSLSFSKVNLTKDTYELVKAEKDVLKMIEPYQSLNKMMMDASSAVVGEADQKKFRETFSRDNMLKAFANGQTSIKMDHMMRFSPTHMEWIESGFDLTRHPITGEVVGICHVKSQNETQISCIMLNGALEKDYLITVLICGDSGEYYLYENKREAFFVHRQNYWNRAIDRLLGIANPSEKEGICSNMSKERVMSVLSEKEEYTYAFYGSYQGTQYRMEANYRYVDKEHSLLLGTLRNITDTSLYQQYKFESEHDALTGLYNRKTVFEKCRELLNTCPEEQFVITHIDMKHFRLFNTFFGDKAGDKLLCDIADLLRSSVGDYEHWVYGRIEADVFCAFFPYEPDKYQKHITAILKYLRGYRSDFLIEPKVGMYLVTDPEMSVETMFTRATLAAKEVRPNTKNATVMYDEKLEQELSAEQDIINEMQTAIEQEQFVVYLQPKYSLRSEKLIGAEALVRWKHPIKGMISPGLFIPTFEKNGYIAELDKYMWEHVCQILKRWHDEGKKMYPVSVNISRVSMYSHATVPFLKSLIKKYKIEPKYLELELTESAYMDDPEDLKRMLKELQEFGFNILMDDFGSGYSSLNTLRDLPVNVLKLDMKFLSMAQDDARGNAVLSSVVRMSKLLNLPIVAEGVEKQEQADYLRSIGCEYVQGFLFAKPMPTTDYEALLGAVEKQTEISDDEEPVSLAEADVVLEESFLSLGLLEYDKDRFAYLRTNKKFLKEFDLIENLKPASRVFREHMDDTSYNILLQAFASCSETKEDSLCFLKWKTDDGIERKYHGYVHYHGNIGNYADLAVTFMNVTKVNIIYATKG